MTILEKVTEKIEEQQKGHEDTAVFFVGEQLKDICCDNPFACELVLKDLENESMTICECEKKIKALADEKHRKKGGNSAFVSPKEAEGIIKEFYGITDDANSQSVEKKKSAGIVNLADYM